MEKVIITAAICGAEVTKEQNPAVPYTVEEIVREAKSAYDAGAAVIHLHVREDDGTPTQSRDRFQECMDAIRRECPDVIIQVSTGGAIWMSDEERLQPLDVIPAPEYVTLDCGTCNFNGDIFVNRDSTIINFAKTIQERGLKPELECFDKGMLDIVLKTAGKKGYLDQPMHFNFVLGVQMAPTIRDLSFCVESLPPGCTWSGCGIGRYQFHIAAASILMGGHVRVGFEDNLYLEKGVLAKSNGELVEKAVEIAKILGRRIATPDEARRILGITRI